MPKTKLAAAVKTMKENEFKIKCSGAKPVPKINPFTDMLEQYMKKENISKKDLAKIIGCTQQNINYKLRKPADDWNTRDVIDFSKALGIDLLYAEAVCVDAVIMSEEYSNKWDSS